MKNASIRGIPYEIRRPTSITWVQTGAFPDSTGTVVRIDDICVNNGILYAIGLWCRVAGGTNWSRSRVWSYDPGTNAWTSCGDPAGTNETTLAAFKPNRLCSLNNVLYALQGYQTSTSAPMVYSFSGGTTWVSCGHFYASDMTLGDSLATDGTAIYAVRWGTYCDAVMRWISGTSWANIGEGGMALYSECKARVYNHGTTIVSVVQGNTRANDKITKWAGGTSWTDIGKPTRVNAGYPLGLASDGSQLYVGHVPDSANLPEMFAYSAPSSWVAKGTLNLNGATFYKSMLFHGSDIFAGSTSDDVEKLTPPSTTWTSQTKPYAGNDVFAGASLGGLLYVATGLRVYHS